MAWAYVAHRGNASNKISSLSVSRVPTANLPVNAIIVVRCSSDNLSTTDGTSSNHTSVTDDKGNTWEKISEWTETSGAANDGVTVSLWITKITTEILTTDFIQVNFSGSITSKSMGIEEFSVASGNTFSIRKVSNNNGPNTSVIGTSVSGIENISHLWVGTVGFEGPDGDTWTQDADYANNTSIGTTGGAAASNVNNRFGTRIFTGTLDTWEATSGTARDATTVFVALDEIIPIPFPPLFKKVERTLIRM